MDSLIFQRVITTSSPVAGQKTKRMRSGHPSLDALTLSAGRVRHHAAFGFAVSHREQRLACFIQNRRAVSVSLPISPKTDEFSIATRLFRPKQTSSRPLLTCFVQNGRVPVHCWPVSSKTDEFPSVTRLFRPKRASCSFNHRPGRQRRACALTDGRVRRGLCDRRGPRGLPVRSRRR